MRPRDWLVVLALLAAALIAGADDLRQTPIARLLLGECAWRGGEGWRDCRAAPPRWDTLPEPPPGAPPLPVRRTSWQGAAR